MDDVQQKIEERPNLQKVLQFENELAFLVEVLEHLRSDNISLVSDYGYDQAHSESDLEITNLIMRKLGIDPKELEKERKELLELVQKQANET